MYKACVILPDFGQTNELLMHKAVTGNRVGAATAGELCLQVELIIILRQLFSFAATVGLRYSEDINVGDIR